MPHLTHPTPLTELYRRSERDPRPGVDTCSEAMQDLMAQYPPSKPHLYNGEGELRPFVNLFLGEKNIKDLQGLDTPLNDGRPHPAHPQHRRRLELPDFANLAGLDL